MVPSCRAMGLRLRTLPQFPEAGAAETTAIPIIKLLEQFQISPEKATYVCELYATGGEHLYQFCYRLAGQILRENDLYESEFNWGTGCCGHEPYPYGAAGFPEPQFDLMFSAQLPWILEEPDQ